MSFPSTNSISNIPENLDTVLLFCLTIIYLLSIHNTNRNNKGQKRKMRGTSKQVACEKWLELAPFLSLPGCRDAF